MLKRQQLRDKLLAELTSGQYQPGQKLPPENEIAGRFHVSVNTVRYALRTLQRQGLVRRVQGKGTFATDQVRAATPTPAHGPASGQPRTGTFGLIVLSVATDYYREFFAEFERAAGLAGHSTSICNSNNDVDRQGNHILGLLSQHAAGVVLNPSSLSVTPAYHVRTLHEAGIPVVLMHRGVPHITAPVLEIPSLEVGRRAGAVIAEAGHRRVGFLASTRSTGAEKLLEGMREALAEAGVEVPDEFVDFGCMTGCDAASFQQYEAHVEDALRRMMLSDGPTAVFASSAEGAEYVYLAALRMNLRVPDDLSIVCHGSAHPSGAVMRMLTTISLDERAAADRAVQLLLEMKKGKRSFTQGEIVPVPLGYLPGRTLGPPSDQLVSDEITSERNHPGPFDQEE